MPKPSYFYFLTNLPHYNVDRFLWGILGFCFYDNASSYSPNGLLIGNLLHFYDDADAYSSAQSSFSFLSLGHWPKNIPQNLNSICYCNDLAQHADMWHFFFLFCSLEKGVELDYHWVEFDDVRYHIQVIWFTSFLVQHLCGKENRNE